MCVCVCVCVRARAVWLPSSINTIVIDNDGVNVVSYYSTVFSFLSFLYFLGFCVLSKVAMVLADFP